MPKKKFSRLSKSIYKLILTVTLILTVIFIYQHFLIIRQVICQTNTGSCPANLTGYLGEKLGHSLLFYDRQQLIKQINEEFAPEKIEFKPSLPGILTVSLYFSGSEIPIKLISSNHFSNELINLDTINLIQYFISSNPAGLNKITSEGRVLESTTDSNLYLIVNNTDTESIKNIVSNIQKLHQAHIQYTEGYIIPPNLIIIRNSNQYVVFSLENSIEKQIISLQQLERAATIRNSRLIDLRFNRPIVR